MLQPGERNEKYQKKCNKDNKDYEKNRSEMNMGLEEKKIEEKYNIIGSCQKDMECESQLKNEWIADIMTSDEEEDEEVEEIIRPPEYEV